MESELLLAWYDQHRRTLPWRGTSDPYAVWVSETMLQQTRVGTVLSYYPRFLDAFPDLAHLAAAEEDEVLKLWEGLGYYSRARNLHRGAQQVMAEYNGILPHEPERLLKIHGIGPYTAGAIASIAFGQAVPAVDGNVIRVVSRLRGIRENVGIPSVKRALAAAAAALVPADRPGDFNQAVMDLGSAICTPGTPDCDACPLRSCCDAYQNGDAEELPVLPRKNPPKEICWDLFIVIAGDRVLLRRRTEALLNGLWIFPMAEGHHAQKDLPAALRRLTGIRPEALMKETDAKHIFTHQVWQMRIWSCRIPVQEAPAGWSFVSLADMDALTFPTAIKAALVLARQQLEENI